MGTPTATQEQWRLHSAQQDMLQQEVESQPLVGDLEIGFSTLKQQLEGASHGFQTGLETITKRGYKGFRRVRGDGNCFFRGFMFRLVESLVIHVRFLRRRVCQPFKNENAMILTIALFKNTAE
jgi:hypothetical protein